VNVDECPGHVASVDLVGYEEVWDALRQRDLRQSLYDAGSVVMDGCLLDLHGTDHQARRRLENRLFRRGTFRRWEAELVPGVIADALAPFVAAGGADLLELGYRTTINLTALVAGIDRPTGSPAETEALQEFAVRFSEGAVMVHSHRDLRQVEAEVGEALERFDQMFLQPSVARRLELLDRHAAGDLDEEELPSDVLTAILGKRAALGLSPDVVRREVAFYLQAGSHSTADAFAHAVDEIFGWAARFPDQAHRLTDDVFLQRCVHETFRLHPASPVAQRRALADVTMRDGRTIPAGAAVQLDLRAANRDVAIFGADASSFDPDRLVPRGVPPWGHTFGGGMHACIGMELDGGTVWSDDAPSDHVLGTVPLMVRALLDQGARPDPAHPPTKDPYSARDHFHAYPVVFRP